MQYRVATWNILSEKFDLSVAYYDKDRTNNPSCKFNKIHLKSKRFGSFVITSGVRRLAKHFDVVLFCDDLHVPSYCMLPFLPHKYRLLGWSIGFRVSYTHPYIVNRPHGLVDKIYETIIKECDAYILYMRNAMDFWKSSNIDFSKFFVAPNTTEVLPINIDKSKKKDIIFIGSLYRGKGVDLLIKAFHKARISTQTDARLIIIGGGEMTEELKNLSMELGIDKAVVFTGPIYNENEIASYFEKSILCVSPTQGGLSCPKSMGYGVPFVTKRNAITGGEIYHITNGVNGIFYDNDEELSRIIEDALKDNDKYFEMGRKAQEYYCENATPRHMANGIIEAIDFVLS